MQKIKDYYIKIGDQETEFQKRIIVNSPDKPKMEVGEILHFPKFEDVVYTEKQREFMRLALEKLKKERLNLLFSGYAGTGKTYSSKMLAAETGRKFVYLNGNYSKDKLLDIMQNLSDGSLVCIDEIHNLRENTAELIYPAIEDNEISIDGMMIKLNNIIFVGTTTEPEKLPKPLLDRFMRIEFEEPPIEIMKKILEKRDIPNDCIDKLLNFTINIRIIKKIIDYVELYGKKNLENFLKVFNLMKINLYSGLSEDQEKYIDYLKKVGKASVRNLGFVLRRSENYIKADIEPDLIRKEMIAITSRGRELNPEFSDKQKT